MTVVEAIKEAIKHAEGIMDENLEMTKEEAKDYIREWCPYDRQEEIIKALEQEPCEDCISRDMALEKMADYVASGYAVSAEDFEEYSRIICQLPPVTPQPKVGHWIEDAKTYYEELNKRGLGVDEYTPYFTDDIACSECLAKYSVIDNETQFFKHCPNCGARMEGK